MIFWIYFWIYTFIIIIIWAFFIIAKIHSLKFKNYQPKIEDFSKIITIVLAVLSIIWYIAIFIYTNNPNTIDLREKNKQENISDSIIPDNIWEDYY